MTGFSSVSEEVVWQGLAFSVVRGTFSDPDGESFEREIVRMHDAVGVVPLLDDGETVLLVRQFRVPVGIALLEIPAGKLDVEGEDLEAAAARELVEEVGRRPGRLEELARFYNSAGTTDEETTVYLARDLTEAEIAPVGVEERHMAVETILLDEAPLLIATGRIVDPKTVIGLLLARERVRAG